MTKMITFSFHSTTFKHVKATETFTLDELSIDKQLRGASLEQEIQRLYETWVWHQLNIESSIIIDEISSSE